MIWAAHFSREKVFLVTKVLDPRVVVHEVIPCNVVSIDLGANSSGATIQYNLDFTIATDHFRYIKIQPKTQTKETD